MPKADPTAGVIGLGTQAIGLIDQYVRNMQDADAQDRLYDLTRGYQAQALAEQISSRVAGALIQQLQVRIANARTASEITGYLVQIDRWRQVEAAAKAREARVQRWTMGIGVASVVVLCAGGLYLGRGRWKTAA